MATLDWIEAELTQLGPASIQRLPFGFDRYEPRWEVRIDGEVVPSLPLFYEGVGSVTTMAPAVATVSVVGGAAIPDLDTHTRHARSVGARALVLATDFGTGRLSAVNREPRLGHGLPTLCVAGSLGERLASSQVAVSIEASLVEGHSANVSARYGDAPDRERLLLTTPLSGWFRSQGERGTGIAVLLGVARTLAAAGVPLTVLATSGHELEGYGVRRFLAATQPEEKATFHFGASVAAGDADGVIPPTGRTPYMRATAWTGDDRVDALRTALATFTSSIVVPADDEARSPSAWVGEARQWGPLGKPLVSIAGAFTLFHTPEDTPERSTTPELLHESYGATLAVAQILAGLPN